jgi:hypothetical protein
MVQLAVLLLLRRIARMALEGRRVTRSALYEAYEE